VSGTAGDQDEEECPETRIAVGSGDTRPFLVTRCSTDQQIEAREGPPCEHRGNPPHFGSYAKHFMLYNCSRALGTKMRAARSAK
jgi:hypothetical protein